MTASSAWRSLAVQLRHHLGAVGGCTAMRGGCFDRRPLGGHEVMDLETRLTASLFHEGLHVYESSV
jgi:hypothetical protein